MKNGWTPERKAAQSQAIHSWKSWEKSTGAKTTEGKARSSQNNYRHGMRTKAAVELRKLLATMARDERKARGAIN